MSVVLVASSVTRFSLLHRSSIGCVCDLETSIMRKPTPKLGHCAKGVGGWGEMMLQIANSMNMEIVKMEIMHRKQQLIEFGQVILRESEREKPLS